MVAGCGSEPRTTSSSSRAVIALDVDEVLGQFLSALSRYYNRVYGTSYTIGDYKTYLFGDLWNVSQEESTKRVYDFFESEEFANIEPVPGAVAGVAFLKQFYDLVVVTSRQNSLIDITIAWLKKHFGEGTFAAYEFGNTYDKDGGRSRSKREMCLEVGAAALVDDLPKYVEEAASVLPVAVGFNFNMSYGWGVTRQFTEQLPRAHLAASWEEICRILCTHIPLPTGAKPFPPVALALGPSFEETAPLHEKSTAAAQAKSRTETSEDAEAVLLKH